MRTTKADGLFPKIEWEEFEKVESDIDERMEVFRCEGIGSDNNSYSGNAYYFAGIFEEVKDIDLA